MIKPYLQVVKPGIIGGNLITATAGFLLASGGNVKSAQLEATLIGIGLVIASACVLNNNLDRDLDRLMSRTRDRVLATGAMQPCIANFYALLLGITGALMLWEKIGTLVFSIVLTGFIIYIGVYTIVLKRRSVYAALVGSFSGAAPPVAGYCAASGCFDTGAMILLLAFSLWQIPHFYAIAVYRLDDYIAASIPVIPARRGVEVTRRHIIAFIVAFCAASMLLGFYGYAGVAYLSVTGASALVWLGMAWVYQPSEPRIWARRLFFCSIAIVCLLSVTMSIDATPLASSQTLVYAFR